MLFFCFTMNIYILVLFGIALGLVFTQPAPVPENNLQTVAMLLSANLTTAKNISKINLIGQYWVHLPKFGNLIQNTGEITYFGGCNEYTFSFSQLNGKIRYRAPILVQPKKTCKMNFDKFFINTALKSSTVEKTSENESIQKYLDKDGRVLLYRQQPVPRALIQYSLSLPPVKVSIDRKFLTFKICSENILSYKVRQNGQIEFTIESIDPIQSCDRFKYDQVVISYLLNSRKLQLTDDGFNLTLNEQKNEDNARFEATRSRKIIFKRQKVKE